MYVSLTVGAPLPCLKYTFNPVSRILQRHDRCVFNTTAEGAIESCTLCVCQSEEWLARPAHRKLGKGGRNSLSFSPHLWTPPHKLAQACLAGQTRPILNYKRIWRSKNLVAGRRRQPSARCDEASKTASSPLPDTTFPRANEQRTPKIEFSGTKSKRNPFPENMASQRRRVSQQKARETAPR